MSAAGNTREPKFKAEVEGSEGREGSFFPCEVIARNRVGHRRGRREAQAQRRKENVKAAKYVSGQSATACVGRHSAVPWEVGGLLPPN